MTKLDYFTYWNAIAYGVGFSSLCGLRISKFDVRWLAVFLVISSVIVCILGSWVLAYRMRVPKMFHREVLRTQIWLHVLPFAMSFVLISFWPSLVGQKASMRDITAGIVTFAVLFLAWCMVPDSQTQSTFISKIEAMYHTEEAPCLIGVGMALIALSFICSVQ